MKFVILAFFLSFLGVSLSLPLAIQYRNADADVDTLVATKEAAFGGFGGGSAKVSAASVQSAADAFANDAMTVSSSLNSLGTATNAKDIKSLATTAFKAESDEDQRRATLSKAAGSAGTTANSKIVKNTPTVLTGLKNIMNSPTQRTTASNLATIESARNPQILPSITQLSNAAFKAMGMPQTAVTFPATKGASLAASN